MTPEIGKTYLRNGHLVKVVGFQSIGNPVLYHPINKPDDVRACQPEQLQELPYGISPIQPCFEQFQLLRSAEQYFIECAASMGLPSYQLRKSLELDEPNPEDAVP